MHGPRPAARPRPSVRGSYHVGNSLGGRLMSDSDDAVMVDCVNSDRCGGRVTLRLTEDVSTALAGTDFKEVVAVVIHQTCACEYSEDDLDALAARAELQINRLRDEQPSQG